MKIPLTPANKIHTILTIPAIALCAMFMIAHPAAAATLLKIDQAHSSIAFSVKHLGLIPVKGRFKVFEGTATLIKNELKNIYIKIDVDKIDTNEKDRDAHLRGEDFFHVRDDVYDIIPKNRYIEFRAKSYKRNSPTITGELKILKTKRQVTLKVKAKTKLKNKKKVLGVEASGTIDRRKFGLTWQKEGNSIKERIAGNFVGNEVTLIISLLFEPSKKINKNKQIGEKK